MATVEWFLRSVPNFLPLLAERFARQWLRALANIEGRGHDGMPVVLFIDISGEYPKQPRRW
jgi:hypothetical protein